MRFLHLDDHVLFCEGLALALGTFVPYVQVQQVRRLADACTALTGSPMPDIVLADLNLPCSANQVQVVRTLRAVNDAVPLVVVSASEDPRLVQECIDAGAMAYVPKSAGLKAMRDALSRVVSGRSWLPPEARCDTPPVREGWQSPRLTPRQHDVLVALVQGKPNKVIARDLQVSETTVKTHVAAVLAALGVNNRTQAVYHVACHGMPALQVAGEPAV